MGDGVGAGIEDQGSGKQKQESGIGSGERAGLSGEQEQTGIWARAAQVAYRMRRRAATVLVIVAALVFGYHAIFGENGVNVYEQRRVEDKYVQKRIGELQQENARLAQQVKALRSDPDAIEHEARERLHYARPGEVIWTEDGKQATAQPAPPQKK
ncbi:MAG TPA: septum formation initiator family protein [Acidobacteriaceae bacterium]|nr:septum formation initiator family protein [Acidobacteriaceae bacterium]